MVKDRDSKLSELQLENINLKNNLRELQRKLEDARNVNTELVDKLFAASNETTQRKIDSENQRTHDLVDVTLSPNASYDRYLKYFIRHYPLYKTLIEEWRMILKLTTYSK